jgi:DNA excision repair protein ERCC-2
VRWADVVVGDYNYYFDVSALLHAMTLEHEWRVVALVDEAHNLVERGRQMYSATLTTGSFDAARLLAPAELKKPLERVRRAWSRIVRDQETPYVVHATLPSALLSALTDATDAIGALHDDGATRLVPELEAFHREALHFARLAEAFDTHSLFDATLEPPNGVREKRHRTSTLCLRNVVPASFLAPRFARLHGVVLFSGTLAPQRFYADMLGLPDDAGWIDVDSPFDAAQLRVRTVADVSTRYTHRTRSLATVADLIAGEYAERPGNYLAFFGSFDYLAQVAETFAQSHPDVPVWTQERSMDAGARQAFLDRFAADGRGIGFAVLGGSFGEGIDLVGTRLVGVLVATLGLPQVNAINEEMRRRLDARFGAGFDYAYLYPGLRKVVQAAGRVLRGPDDRGSVTLIDDRYARPDVRALLPAWWAIERVRAHHVIVASAKKVDGAIMEVRVCGATTCFARGVIG